MESYVAIWLRSEFPSALLQRSSNTSCDEAIGQEAKPGSSAVAHYVNSAGYISPRRVSHDDWHAFRASYVTEVLGYRVERDPRSLEEGSPVLPQRHVLEPFTAKYEGVAAQTDPLEGTFVITVIEPGRLLCRLLPTAVRGPCCGIFDCELGSELDNSKRPHPLGISWFRPADGRDKTHVLCKAPSELWPPAAGSDNCHSCRRPGGALSSIKPLPSSLNASQAENPLAVTVQGIRGAEQSQDIEPGFSNRSPGMLKQLKWLAIAKASALGLWLCVSLVYTCTPDQDLLQLQQVCSAWYNFHQSIIDIRFQARRGILVRCVIFLRGPRFPSPNPPTQKGLEER